MNTRYECIKTYAMPLRIHGAQCPDGSAPHWDEGLGQNTCDKEPHSYADDAQPPTEHQKAGAELDRLTKVLMEKRPGTTYRQAFGEVLAANPTLKAAYGGVR